MELLFILLAIIIGVITGVFTGLIPGIHVNTIAALMVSISGVLYSFGLSSITIAVFIAVVAITHAFFDYIPSLFIGVPNDEVFALLPGHRLVKQGRGLEAIELSMKGSLNGVFFSVFALIIFIYSYQDGNNILDLLDTYVTPYLFWILLSISLLLIATEANKKFAAFVFMCSGIYGVVVMASPLVPNSNATFNVLFPTLTGIFGISGIILSLFEKVDKMPNQFKHKTLSINKTQQLSSSLQGSGAGMIVGLLPGLGAANAATLMLLLGKVFKKPEREDVSEYKYIVTTSAINTSDTIFAIAALFFIEKTRSGVSVAMADLFNGDFGIGTLLILIVSIAVAAVASYYLMKQYSLFIAKLLSGLNYKALNLSILIFLSVLVYYTTGLWGFIIMMGGAFLGMLAPLLNVRRAQAMGFFLLPVILYYSGFQREIVSLFKIEAKMMIPVPVTFGEVAFSLMFSALLAFCTYFIGKLIFRK